MMSKFDNNKCLACVGGGGCRFWGLKHDFGWNVKQTKTEGVSLTKKKIEGMPENVEHIRVVDRCDS